MSAVLFPQKQTNSIILSTSAAAEYLGLRPQTLRKWRLLGNGPAFVRLGNGPRANAGYLLSDLQDWVNSRRFRSTSEETVAAARTDTASHPKGGAL